MATGPIATIQTTKGDIKIQLFEDDAPNTVANFVQLSEKKFYDGIIFHRVLKNFMAQAGCPLGKGYGGPGYTFPDEINKNSHDRPGTLSMANAGPNTNGSQFFLTFVPTQYLDPKHTVFGRVADDASMKILNSIMLRDPDRGGPSDSIKTITISNKTPGKKYEVQNTRPSNR